MSETADEFHDQLDHIFELMNQIELQTSLVKTFATIGDRAGITRQLKFLTIHATSANLAIARLAELLFEFDMGQLDKGGAQ